MKSRRDFIKASLMGFAGLGLASIPFGVSAKKRITKITILHTNDVHSRVDPFPANDPKYGGLAGVARRASVIKKIRSQEDNVLLLDAGDFFQGTPYFNKYKGEVELKLMSEMGYDAATIGNHDFDNGVEGLAKQLVHANFPLLCVNYDFSKTEMNGKTKPYKVFVKDDIRIGVFGIGIELNGLVDKRMYGETVYLDPVLHANETATLLKQKEKCDLIICLSHLGYKYESKKISDVVLAKSTENIDLIIGGHTHTFLNEPVRFKNKINNEVLVTQVGFAGIHLGKIDYYIEKKTSKKQAIGSTIKISKKSIAI